MTCLCEYRSPVGSLTLASDGEALTGLWLAGQKYFGLNLDPNAVSRHVGLFDRATRWLDEYFRGGRPEADFPLAPAGTPFRQRVWEELRKIPYGRTTTYADIARRLNAANPARPTSARAVGGAVGHNPISIVVPCHRVVGSDGSLTGFAGGIDKKRWLLEWEGGE